MGNILKINKKSCNQPILKKQGRVIILRHRNFFDYLWKIIFFMWRPPDWMQISARFFMLFMTALVTPGPMALISVAMASFNSVTVLGLSRYTLSFR